MNPMNYYFYSEAPKFEPFNRMDRDINELPAKLSMKYADGENEFKEEVEYIGPNQHRVQLQYYSEKQNPITTDYELGYTRKSNLTIKGTEMIPPETLAVYPCVFNDDGIQDFDSFFENENGSFRPMSLLGTYTLSPSRTAKGIASGTLIMEVDSFTTYQSRQVQYTLNDEQLIINGTIQNDFDHNLRLRISNSFLIAEQFEFGVNEFIEVALLKNDMYQIEIIIKPSGVINHTCRLLR